MKAKIYLSMMLLPMIAMASETFTIGDRVWHDTNENWEQDSGEQGMADVKVMLYTESGKRVKTTTTNKEGTYHFYGIKEGDYVVKVIAPEGTEIVTDSKRELWLDKNRKDIDFGLHNKNHKGDYSIGDRVWSDTNENWEQDKNEKGIAGVSINLFKASGEKVSSTKTNQNGNYSFEELAEGDYVVKVVVPKDMTAITDTKLEVWLDKSRVDKDFGLLKKSTPPNGKPITLEKLKEMIANGEDVTKVNTSEITDMSGLFAFNETFNQDISGWDVSKVTNMSAMFRGAKAFNQPIGNWDVSNVTNMGFMFQGAIVFNQSIGKWNVSNVIAMNAMFSETNTFNQPIGNWDVSKVRAMNAMFRDAIFFNQPIGSWNVSNVTVMNAIFSGAKVFNQPIGNWDVSKVVNMSSMFKEAKAFNQPLNNWNVSNVTDMEFMFSEADTFNQPLNNWDVSKVGLMTNMFFYMDNFNQDISMWNVDNVRKWTGFYAGTDIADEKIPERFRK